MTTQQTLVALTLLGLSSVSFADALPFEFDRPGTGFSTSTVPVGQLAWEQSLANVQYLEYQNDIGQKVKHTQVNADILLRTGLTQGLELQLGWQGPAWSKTKVAGQSVEDDGLGDVSIGLKKSIDLNDDQLSMALLAQAVIATGNDNFSIQDDLYSLGSAVSYQYSEDITTSISMFYAVQDGHWSVTAVPTLEYTFVDKLGGYSEFVYSKTEGQDYAYSLGSGLVYKLTDRLQLDASIAIGLDGNHDQYQAGFGFAYGF
jgi:hypothetical protein